MLNPAFDPNTYSHGLIGLVEAFVPGRQRVTKERAEAWTEQLRRAGSPGNYFFSLNRYLFLAVKEGSYLPPFRWRGPKLVASR